MHNTEVDDPLSKHQIHNPAAKAGWAQIWSRRPARMISEGKGHLSTDVKVVTLALGPVADGAVIEGINGAGWGEGENGLSAALRRRRRLHLHREG